MEFNQSKRRTLWITALVLGLGVTTMAWTLHQKESARSYAQFSGSFSPQNDTTPKAKSKPPSKKYFEYDGNLDDLDKAMRELDKSMKDLSKEFNSEKWEDMDKEIKNAMKEIDFDKIQLETEKAMKSIDWDKMESEIKDAFDNARNNIDWDEINHQMDKAKKEWNKNKDKYKQDWEKSWKEGMKNAEKGMKNAKIEISRMRDFIKDLEKDGLIKNGEPYSIEFKDGELYINDKKQPKNITDKYRNSEKYKKYFDKDNNWKIKSNGKESDDDDDLI